MLLVGGSTVVSQLALTQGWGKGKTLLCANLQFSSIVFGELLGWLVFDEALSPVTYIGVVVILLTESAAVGLQWKRQCRLS